MRAKLLLIAILLGLVVSDVWAKEWTVPRNLGDLNGDGVKEVAVESWSDVGSAGKCAGVQIFSGKKKVVNGLIGVGGNCADGYRVVGREIVSWAGNWDDDDKWHPHCYDFTWYAWNKHLKEFEDVKRGRTKKKYAYSQAKSLMPQLAKNPGLQIAIFYEEPVMTGSDIKAIYQRAEKLKKDDRDEFILKEIGLLHCRQRERQGRAFKANMTQKERKNWGRIASSRFSVYEATIYRGWAKVSLDARPNAWATEVYQKSRAGRWELVSAGDELELMGDGTISPDIAKHLKIYDAD